MSSVEFEENQDLGITQGRMLYGRFVPSHEPPAIVKGVLKTGLVKDEGTATIIIFVVTIVFLILSITIFFLATNSTFFINLFL
jgi:hypothetical protein